MNSTTEFYGVLTYFLSIHEGLNEKRFIQEMEKVIRQMYLTADEHENNEWVMGFLTPFGILATSRGINVNKALVDLILSIDSPQYTESPSMKNVLNFSHIDMKDKIQ